MKTLLLCLLSFNSILYAQQITWRSGAVVLDSDKVRVGEICIQDVYDLVLFRVADSVTVYPAHRIQSVRYYDETINVNRKYISIKDDHAVYRMHHLYEVVLQGEWSVLRRQNSLTMLTGSVHDRDDYQYYLKSTEQIIPLMNFRAKVYPQLLENSRNEVLAFITVNKLNPNLAADAIRIINFYNKQTLNNVVAKNDVIPFK